VILKRREEGIVGEIRTRRVVARRIAAGENVCDRQIVGLPGELADASLDRACEAIVLLPRMEREPLIANHDLQIARVPQQLGEWLKLGRAVIALGRNEIL